MRQALKNQPTTGVRERQAIAAFKTKKAVDKMAEAGGVDEEGKQQIRELASAQVGAFPAEAAQAIRLRMEIAPQNMSDAIQQRFLRPIARMIEVSDTPKDVQIIDNPDHRAAASYVVVGQHFMIGEQRAKIVEALTQAEADVAKDIEDMKGMPALEAKTRMLHALSQDLPTAYEIYLKNVIATSGPDTTLSATARELIRRAQVYAGDRVVPPGAVTKAIEALVDNDRIVTKDMDAKGILAQLWQHGGNTGVSPEQSLLLFGNPDGSGANGLIPVLARVRNLPAIIEALRGIKTNSVQALKEIEAFKSNFANTGNAKAVGVTTAMKRYAKLVMASRDADTVLSTLDKKYAKDRSRLLGAEEALRYVDDILKSEGYQDSVTSAADALGVTISEIFNEASGEVRLKGPISNRDYILSRVPTKEMELENRRQAEDLLQEIGTLVNDPNADPIKKRTWSSIGERFGATWLESISSPMESKVYPLDIKALMPWLRNQQGVFEQIGGRLALDTRRMFQAVDSIGDLIQREERNENYGLAKHSVLTAEAMTSHGMNPKDPHDVQRYERSIANVLLGRQKARSCNLAAQCWCQAHYTSTLKSVPAISPSQLQSLKTSLVLVPSKA